MRGGNIEEQKNSFRCLIQFVMIISFCLIFFCVSKVWFKNKRAKCRQIQKQNTSKTTETPTNLSKKTMNASLTTKLKAKSPSTLFNSSSGAASSIAETSNFIKAQNPFLIPGGSSKVIKLKVNLSELSLRVFLDLFVLIVTIESFRNKLTKSFNMVTSTYWRSRRFPTTIPRTPFNVTIDRIAKVFFTSLVTDSLQLLQCLLFKHWLS